MVAAEFNPYREWLGLEARGRPNFYGLIGVANFEGDGGRIASAAERATTRVRSFRPGANARLWAGLLDEIRAAKECLCDPARKAEYDAGLRVGQFGDAAELVAGLAETTSWMAGPTPIFGGLPVATAEAYAEVNGELPMAIPLGTGGAAAGAETDMDGRINAAAFAAPVVNPPAANAKVAEAPRADLGLLIVGLIGVVLLIVAAAVYVVLAT
jgi:hypothetical protein